MRNQFKKIKKFWRSKWKIVTLISGGFFLLFLLAQLFIFSPSYIFNVNAKSAVFSLKIPNKSTHQKWRIDDAIICSKKELKLEDHKLEIVARNICQNRRLNAYHFSSSELTLELTGGTEILMELLKDDALAMSIRQLDDVQSNTKLSFTNGSADIILGSKFNILWLPNTAKELIFPFTGNTTLGRDINYSTRGILQSGNIKVYTSDSSSASKRILVDQTDLVLGDQVRLAGSSSMKYPKGFVRYSYESDKNILDIVAFGEAKWIHVDRFGGNGYEFQPGLLARISNHPILIMIATLLLAFFSLLSNLVEIFRKN